MGRDHAESGVVWITTIFMVIFHLGAIAAFSFFSWTNLVLAAVLCVFAINAGISMGYHRLLVHRGYQVAGCEDRHNNHHANPVSARHGLAWYEFDPNYYGIWVLNKLGLAKHVRIAKFTRRNPGQTECTTHMHTS